MKFSASFGAANFNKASLMLDLETMEGKDVLWHLLRGADVLVTNLDQKMLASIGFAFAEVKMQLPHLICAVVTPSHLEEPGTPADDTGAFFAATGMASIVHPKAEGDFRFPITFGDSATSSSLLAGIAVALRARQISSKGQQVDASVHRTGCWCIAPYLVEQELPGQIKSSMPKPEYTTNPVPEAIVTRNGLCTSYLTSDLYNVYLLERGDQAKAHQRLQKVLGLGTFNAADFNEIMTERMASMTKGQAVKALRAAKIEHCEDVDIRTIIESGQVLASVQKARCFLQADGDSSYASMPFKCHLGGSPARNGGMFSLPPSLGQHNKALWAKNFWAPRAPEAGPPLTAKYNDPPRGLAGLVVVELSADGVAPSSTCAQLADYGATVHTVVTPEIALVWQEHPKFFNHVNRGKGLIKLNPRNNSGDKKKLQQHILNADIFVTNFAERELVRMGIDATTLQKKNPSLIYGLMTPMGLGQSAEPRCDLASFWALSGNASLFGYGTMPMYLGELMASFHLLAGITCATFHRERTGKGLFVDSSLLATGVFAQNFVWNAASKVPKLREALLPSMQLHVQDRTLNPTMASYCTCDGVWVQLLGLEWRDHLENVVHALRDSWPTKAMQALTSIGDFFQTEVTRTKKKQSELEKMAPLLAEYESNIRDAIASYSFENFKFLADFHGIPYSTVATPTSMINCSQSHMGGNFVYTQFHPFKLGESQESIPLQTGHQWFLNTPAHMSNVDHMRRGANLNAAHEQWLPPYLAVRDQGQKKQPIGGPHVANSQTRWQMYH